MTTGGSHARFGTVFIALLASMLISAEAVAVRGSSIPAADVRLLQDNSFPPDGPGDVETPVPPPVYADLISASALAAPPGVVEVDINTYYAVNGRSDLAARFPCFEWTVVATADNHKSAGWEWPHPIMAIHQNTTFPTDCEGSGGNGGMVIERVPRNHDGSPAVLLFIFWDVPTRGNPTAEDGVRLKHALAICAARHDPATSIQGTARCAQKHFGGRGILTTIDKDRNLGYNELTIGPSPSIVSVKVDTSAGKQALIGVALPA